MIPISQHVTKTVADEAGEPVAVIVALPDGGPSRAIPHDVYRRLLAGDHTGGYRQEVDVAAAAAGPAFQAEHLGTEFVPAAAEPEGPFLAKIRELSEALNLAESQRDAAEADADAADKTADEAVKVTAAAEQERDEALAKIEGLEADAKAAFDAAAAANERVAELEARVAELESAAPAPTPKKKK